MFGTALAVGRSLPASRLVAGEHLAGHSGELCGGGGCAAVPEWRTMLAAGFEAARREPSPNPRNVLRCSAAGLTTRPRRIRRRLRAETPVRTGQAGSYLVETMSADESTGASDSLSFRAKPEERAGERRFQLRNASLSGSLPVRSSRGEKGSPQKWRCFLQSRWKPALPCVRIAPAGSDSPMTSGTGE